jgi:hypothetical protein
MTTPAVSAREPKRVGAILPELETRPAPCPECGEESVAVRYAPPASLSEALRKRLDPERPFIPQRCAACIAKIELAAERERVDRQCAQQLDRLDVPALYANVSLDTFELHGDAAARQAQGKALAFTRDFIATWPDVPMITVFAGNPGTGKGHLSWAIAKHVAGVAGDRRASWCCPTSSGICGKRGTRATARPRPCG